MLADEKIVELLVHLLCGGVGGGLATVFSYPFTNLRLRRISEYKLFFIFLRDLKLIKKDSELQNQVGETLILDKKKFLDNLLENINIAKYALDTINKQGFSSLYSGILSSIIGSSVQNGTYFFISKLADYAVDYSDVKLHPLVQSILINFVAAIFTATVTNPIWVLNARMAKKEENEKNMGNIDMIKKIVKEEGCAGFLKGMVPSLILTLVPVIQFTSYEVLKDSISDHSGKISSKNVVMISFFSKFISILVNYPLMTVKTLYQSNSTFTNNEIAEILKKVLRKEGIFGLYKGLGSKILGSVLNNIILMLTYERLQNIVRLLLARMILGKSSSKIIA